jgi:alkanesulfonate monooxygenase SsuD/methylene tetrahydromethanopterin reductase-like flavin-dependent oxidoreductase (luciferase family)
MILGLGVSHRPVVEGWYGQEIGKPVREMREYLSAVRAIFRGEDPPAGEKWPTGFHFMGYEARADLPIYIAGLSPAMLRLAGELADGVVLWLCEPSYIREVVVPEVTKGREKAGKPLDGFDIVAAVPAAVTDDPNTAREVMRKDLTPYFHLPFYRAMIERSGFEPDLEKADPFIDTLAAIGTADEANAVIDRYFEAGATSPGVGPIARTDFGATLDALRR